MAFPKIEIMAPAGSWESLQAAIQAKADSVYFGIGHLNMRSHSAMNFSIDDLKKIVGICRKNRIKAYVTLNSIIYDGDLSSMKKYCQAIQESGADAVIASDIAVLEYARSIGCRVHISTQLNVSNIEAVRFFSRYADAVVLARELTLSQIKAICESIRRENICGPCGQPVQVELFAHGALCVSIAGKCHMSLALYNESANRGRCVQPCRRRYRVIDEETQNELVIDNRYVMSPKDLITVGMLDQIIDAGVSILKIEGRGRAPEYVYTVASVYREAVDAFYARLYTKEKIAAWHERLQSVYNRGFWEGGYYLGEKQGAWSGAVGSQASQKKKYIGKVTKYFSKIRVAEVKIESASIKVGDPILITGPTTGIWQGKVESLHQDGPVDAAAQGAVATFPCNDKVRKNDKLYLIER
jgi:U32 family peptidase